MLAQLYERLSRSSPRIYKLLDRLELGLREICVCKSKKRAFYTLYDKCNHIFADLKA